MAEHASIGGPFYHLELYSIPGTPDFINIFIFTPRIDKFLWQCQCAANDNVCSVTRIFMTFRKVVT